MIATLHQYSFHITCTALHFQYMEKNSQCIIHNISFCES